MRGPGFSERVWAVEGCNGIGKHLGHRLVRDGEAVADVPAKLSAQVRVFAVGNGRETDPADAHSVAPVALRTPNLVTIAIDPTCWSWMLVDRHDELGRAKTQTINRLHRLLLELLPGGAKRFLSAIVVARGSTLLKLHGIGPSGAARPLADVGDVTRFATRYRFASWNGTTPLDASSGQQLRHRLSRAGNRRITRTLHVMAAVQLRNPTEGRAYFNAGKAAGKTSTEAMRALERRLSNVVYQRMLRDHRPAMRQAREGTRGRLCTPA